MGIYVMFSLNGSRVCVCVCVCVCVGVCGGGGGGKWKEGKREDLAFAVWGKEAREEGAGKRVDIKHCGEVCWRDEAIKDEKVG